MTVRDDINRADAAPTVKIVAGHPDDDEVAAVLAVLRIMRSRTSTDARTDLGERPSDWASYWQRTAMAGSRP